MTYLWDVSNVEALITQGIPSSLALGETTVPITVHNLQRALEALQPSRKRKVDDNDTEAIVYQDPYRIWLQIPHDDADPGAFNWTGDYDDVPSTVGARLAQLTLGGLINGLARYPVVSVKNPLQSTIHPNTTNIPSANNITYLQLWQLATAVQRNVQNKVHQDILVSTPLRIQKLLCDDEELEVFESIRSRVYETVIMGNGLHQRQEQDDTLATGNVGAQHDVEKFHKCPTCDNNDQASFVMDRKNGDIICSNCGTIVSESLMHEGSAYRKFEGEEDRNHHGDTPNALYSNSHNLGTTLGGLSADVGAGKAGWGAKGGTGGKRNLETILRNAHAYTELNVSQFGKTDRRTRIGYKDKQKREAFHQMQHVGDALNLHDAVIQRAKELFAGFRDDRELVQQFKGVIAACLVEAFEQLSRQGRAIVRGQEQPEAQSLDEETVALNARAQRRNQLHHANLAGKGGLLLDLENNAKEEKEQNEKPASSWDMDDCRSWLLETSRRIAHQWIDIRKKGGPEAKHIPSGSLEELEGTLVDHSITLCEELEKESKRKSVSKQLTRRVSDISKLGIQWQQKQERGNFINQADGSSRTAGQTLILMRLKKLVSVLNDPFVAESFHREIRGIVAKQETEKLKQRQDESSRQRLQQMKRKPWLQKRIQA